jgi:hypothetical protein
MARTFCNAAARGDALLQTAAALPPPKRKIAAVAAASRNIWKLI